MGVICDCSGKEIKKIPVKEIISFDSFMDHLLTIHNEFRKEHNSPNLKLNPKLCDMAKDYAKELISNKNKDNTKKYNNEILGSNIYLSETKDNQPEKIIKKWYNEKENFDYDYNYFQKNAAHFTQMVWKGTKEIGIGIVEEDKFCLVLFYYPPGNILGKFTDNVENPNKKKK